MRNPNSKMGAQKTRTFKTADFWKRGLREEVRAHQEAGGQKVEVRVCGIHEECIQIVGPGEKKYSNSEGHRIWAKSNGKWNNERGHKTD